MVVGYSYGNHHLNVVRHLEFFSPKMLSKDVCRSCTNRISRPKMHRAVSCAFARNSFVGYWYNCTSKKSFRGYLRYRICHFSTKMTAANKKKTANTIKTTNFSSLPSCCDLLFRPLPYPFVNFVVVIIKEKSSL